MGFYVLLLNKKYMNNLLGKNYLGVLRQGFSKRNFSLLFCLAFLFFSFSSSSFGVERVEPTKDELAKQLYAATMFCTNVTGNDIDPCVVPWWIDFDESDLTDGKYV